MASGLRAYVELCSEADCEYLFDFIMEEGRMICSFQKDWTDLEMKFLLL